MRKSALCAALLAMLLCTAGCGSDVIADRFYTQAIGLHQEGETLWVSLQSFDEDTCRTVQAATIPEALRQQEAQVGGRVFIGHTELICLDESVDAELIEELFLEQGISPACKVINVPQDFLKTHDSTQVVHCIRMAERNGLTEKQDLTTYLESGAVSQYSVSEAR